MRCLLIHATELDDPDATLIVPAAIYDAGTELAINLKDRIEYIQLTKFIIGTKSFTEFSYRMIGRPESEEENIRRLKQLL
jgi:hypothetical protein